MFKKKKIDHTVDLNTEVDSIAVAKPPIASTQKSAQNPLATISNSLDPNSPENIQLRNIKYGLI